MPFNGFAAENFQRVHLALPQQGNGHASPGQGADALCAQGKPHFIKPAGIVHQVRIEGLGMGGANALADAKK